MFFRFKKFVFKHKTLLISLGAVFFYAATIAYASGGPFLPGTTTDPDCVANATNCYVENGVIIGQPVWNGTASQVLYTDNAGNVASDSGFTRDSSTGFTDLQATVTTGGTSELQINQNVLSAGLPGGAFTYQNTTLPDLHAGIAAGDASTLTGDAGSEIAAVGINNTGSSTEEADTNYLYDPIADDANANIRVNNSVGGSGNLSQITLDSGFGSSSGSVTIQTNSLRYTWDGTDAYVFPSSNGGNGQVLTDDGSGNLSWTTPAGGGTVLGTGAAGQVAYWSDSGTITSDGDFLYTTGANPVFSVGDLTSSGNGTSFTLSDSTQNYTFTKPNFNIDSVNYVFPSSQAGADGDVLTNDGSGNLSWAPPTGGSNYTFSDSLENITGTVTLVNDSASPGNSKYYGTDSGGTLGYFSLPSGGGGSIGGSIAANEIGYGSGSDTLTGNSNDTIDASTGFTNLQATVGTDETMQMAINNNILGQGIAGGSFVFNNSALPDNYAGMAAGDATGLTGDAGSEIEANGIIGTNSVNQVANSQYLYDPVTDDANISIQAENSLGTASNASAIFLDSGAGASNGQILLYSPQLTYTWDGGADGYRFPASQGSNGQVLTDDGTGVLSWTTPAGSGTVLGTGAADQVAYWSNSGTITSDSDFAYTPGTNPIFSVGDLASAGNGTLFTVDDSTQGYTFSKPNFSIDSVNYVFPSSQAGASGDVLTNDGSGNLSWAPVSGGGGGGGIGGSIAANQIAFGSGTDTITGNSNDTIDASTGYVNLQATISSGETGQLEINNNLGGGTGVKAASLFYDDSTNNNLFGTVSIGDWSAEHSTGLTTDTFVGGIASTDSSDRQANFLAWVDPVAHNSVSSMNSFYGSNSAYVQTYASASQEQIQFHFGTTFYVFPTTNATGVLANDGSGHLSWSSSGASPVAAANSTSLFSNGDSFTSITSSATDSDFLGVSAGDGATNADGSNFLGASAGQNATNASGSNFLGGGAGNTATNANDSNFLGGGAGDGATNADESNFLGADAGDDSVYADGSNFLGYRAGLAAGATNPGTDFDSNFLGTEAGYLATSAYDSNFLGANAGYQANGSNDSNFFGLNTGYDTTNASNSNFLGYEAGDGAIFAGNSNFLGNQAGFDAGATYAGHFSYGDFYSNFFGTEAGYQATYAHDSNFLGLNAGNAATDANDSNFLGSNAGNAATDANNSNFLGDGAGNGATDANNSIFIGTSAGLNDTVDDSAPDDTSILIGDYTSTGGYSNSIALGARATNTVSDQFLIGSTYNNIDIAGVNYVFPSSQAGGTGYVLTNDGSGNLSWASNGGISPIAIQNTTSLFSNGDGFTTINSTGTNDVFLGQNAGDAYSSPNSSNQSNFIGESAGDSAYRASDSNFIGYLAGVDSTYAAYSNFIGFQAGAVSDGSVICDTMIGGIHTSCGAVNASYSNFIGYQAGISAQNANNSIFIGDGAGYADTVNNSSSGYTSILIGDDTSTGGHSNSIALGSHATNSAANQMIIGANNATNAINTLILQGNGNTCTLSVTGTPSCTSDERLKTNITDLPTDTLDALVKLRTVTYNWTNYPDAPEQIGFLAQDVQTEFPQAVSLAPDGYLMVSYDALVPATVEAIRELDLKVTDIQNFATATDTTFLDNLIAWLGSATNGVKDFFAGTVHTNQLCVGTVCVTQDQFLQMVEQSTSSSYNSSSSTGDGGGTSGTTTTGTSGGTTDTTGSTGTSTSGGDSTTSSSSTGGSTTSGTGGDTTTSGTTSSDASTTTGDSSTSTTGTTSGDDATTGGTTTTTGDGTAGTTTTTTGDGGGTATGTTSDGTTTSDSGSTTTGGSDTGSTTTGTTGDDSSSTTGGTSGDTSTTATTSSDSSTTTGDITGTTSGGTTTSDSTTGGNDSGSSTTGGTTSTTGGSTAGTGGSD